MQSDLDKLKKFKFSGYVQARYEISELSKDAVTVTVELRLTPVEHEPLLHPPRPAEADLRLEPAEPGGGLLRRRRGPRRSPCSRPM